MKKIASVLFGSGLFILAGIASAAAQTSPNFTYKFVPTTEQWNSYFAGKQDFLGAPPLLTSGGVMTGPLVTAPSTTTIAGLNVPPGAAPTSPVNGDIWTTTSSIFARINGVTIDLVNGACPTCAVTNATNTFTAVQIINLNGTAAPATQTGTMLQLNQANGVIGRIELDTYGATPVISGLRANGTAASPTGLVANDELISVNGGGFDGTTRSLGGAAMRIFSGSIWSTTNHAAYIDFATVSGADVTKTLTSRVHIENDGGVTLNGATSAGIGTIASLVTFNGETQFQSKNLSTGTAAATYFNASNSVSSGLFGIGGTGWTGNGGVLQNKAFVLSTATSAGIVAYSTGANPIDFYVNAALAARITATGGLSVSSTIVDPGNGIINALNGYRVANAATSGNVLRGNGTNFVSAQLACSDLSGVGTGCSAAAITALTGDGTATGPGSVALTLATVNGNVGTFGSATQASQFTVNGKGLITAASSITVTPAIGSVTGLGSNVLTALQVAVGSAGAFVTFNGAGGTPSSMTATNLTGTAAGLTAGSVTTNANLTGDVTSIGNATTLATVASAGTTGSSTAIPVITINAKGLTTSITTAAVIAPAGTLTGATLAAGVTASSLTSVGTLTSLAVSGTLTSAAHTITSASATALTVGLNGATNPALQVDASTASQAAGLKLTGAATGGTVALAAIDSGSNTNITINAKGTGTIGIGSVSTGAVTITPATTITGALTASTSVASPLHYGGTAAGSTITVSGTSNGSPSSAYVLLQSGTTQFVGINNATPKANLDINANLSTSPALIVATSMFRMQAADTNSSGLEMVTYGTGTQNFVNGAAAGGTAASPTASTVSHGMFNLSGYGYNGTSFQKGNIIVMRPNSTWSGTNQESAIDFYTTPLNSTTVTRVMVIQSSGGVSVGTATDPGSGAILANTSIKATTTLTVAGMTNVASTSAVCYNTVTGLLTFDGTIGTCTISDERLKNVTGPITGALDKILKISGFYYTWKDSSFGKGQQIGVGAQTVESVFPELVQTDSMGRKSADYQRLTAPIIEAIRELKSKIETLKGIHR